MKLFVTGFPNDFDDTDLKEMFELYGTVTSARFVMDRNTGRRKSFGFVEMPDSLEALQTIEALDGAGIKGKKLSIKKAEERSAEGGGGRDNYRSSGRDNFRSGGGGGRDNYRGSRDRDNDRDRGDFNRRRF
ncbi:RNA recognition motif domain-containing protein [Parafilimonas sp.]|jgi:RNA recognition motif-containing protein|uniref:RNA recognition motif domain-containing protein n=1 Tax=Parafilimonas sp. TaxID=1969739 RepID=UPI003F80615B